MDGKVVKKFNVPGLGMEWSRDGRALHYVDPRGAANLLSLPLDGGPPKPITNFTSDQIFGFSWSRDGKRLAVTRGTFTNDVVMISSVQQKD